MNDNELEERLGGFDFSRLSPVREPLFQRLLSMRRSQRVIAERSESLWERHLGDEELDAAVAAGNPAAMMKPKEKR